MQARAGRLDDGSIPLTAGTYLVTLNADFYGVKAPATNATPDLQVALRSAGGNVALTAFTAPFPLGKAFGLASDGTPRGLEQTTSTFGLVSIPAGGDTLQVHLFGYNADQSSNGSGEFGAITSVSVVKVNTN